MYVCSETLTRACVHKFPSHILGCTVKFEQDDKEFMTSEEVADFCTTPGGRKRDNMNFYTSGMKIVLIKEQTSVNSARVSLLFLLPEML